MKIGIIIIFKNLEHTIQRKELEELVNHFDDIQFCLVNNASKDETYEVLKLIKESCEHCSIVNVKISKSDLMAIRAGARYLQSRYNLKFLYYLNANDISSETKCGLKVFSSEYFNTLKSAIKIKTDLQSVKSSSSPRKDILPIMELLNEGSESVNRNAS